MGGNDRQDREPHPEPSGHHFTKLPWAFNIDYHVIRETVIDINDPRSVRTEIIRVIRQVLLPRVDAGVPTIDQKGWTNLKTQLQRITQWIDHLVTAFGERLDPEVYSLVLKIEDHINGIGALAITFFDVLGVPDNELRAKLPSSAVADKRGMEKVIAKEVKQILESCASILEWLNKNSTSEKKSIA